MDTWEEVSSWVATLLENPPAFIRESLRLKLREMAKETVEFGSFHTGFALIPTGQDPIKLVDGKRVATRRTRYTLRVADTNLHQAQLAFIVEALGLVRTKRLICHCLYFLAEQPGSKLIKKSQRDDGLSDPSREEIFQFVQEFFDNWSKPQGVSFDVGKFEKTYFGKTAVFRIEAIVAVTYALLRLLSYKTERWSRKYQLRRFYTRHFERRVREGQVKKLETRKEPVPEYLVTGDKDVIRHLDPEAVSLILREIMN